ncbi:MAG: hypothetical protein GMKNLPBB_03046 [Myxococcota bacterium]|nr:hypothetical protein [Myxococcota bacterium]
MPIDDKTVIRARIDLVKPREERAEQKAVLTVLQGPLVGQSYALDGEQMTIGRTEPAEVIISDDGVSRRHALIQRLQSGKFQITDMNSTNGTYVNGALVETAVLKNGDKLQIGDNVMLKFSFQDEIEEQFQRKLYENATRDGLTRVYNKKFFQDRFGEEFMFALRHKTPMSLMLFDLDHFKKVNDTWGHPCGDYVLQTVAKIVGDALRKEDVMARVGGEEFAVLMRGIQLREGAAAANRMRRLVEKYPFVWEDKPLKITMSAGVAGMDLGRFETPESMIQYADDALYCAKKLGRNRVETGSSC